MHSLRLFVGYGFVYADCLDRLISHSNMTQLPHRQHFQYRIQLPAYHPLGLTGFVLREHFTHTSGRCDAVFGRAQGPGRHLRIGSTVIRPTFRVPDDHVVATKFRQHRRCRFVRRGAACFSRNIPYTPCYRRTGEQRLALCQIRKWRTYHQRGGGFAYGLDLFK